MQSQQVELYKKSESPLVTIGIPTYNRADGFLHNALNCAVNQTYGNLEIIVSDNCSSDNTEELVRSFSDSRIRYVKHQENIGASNNFNYCVKVATGRYFHLLHDDDAIDEDFVASCISAIPKGKDVGVIFTGNRVIDENNTVLVETLNHGGEAASTEDFLLGWFTNRTALYLCSTMFNTEYLQQLGGFHSKTNLFQDAVAEVILAYQYGRADVYDIKASFRRHSANRAGDASLLRAWSVDSMYLMNLIVRMATKDKQRLRNIGLRFFRTKNYKMASSIQSPLKRRLAQLMVDLYFFNYLDLPNKIKRRLGLLK